MPLARGDTVSHVRGIATDACQPLVLTRIVTCTRRRHLGDATDYDKNIIDTQDQPVSPWNV